MKKMHLFSLASFTGIFALAALFALPGFSQEKDKPGIAPKTVAAKLEAALSKLPKADRVLADAQRFCPMMDSTRLGAMGTPVKIMLEDRPVFLCCAGCEEGAKADAKKTLANVEKMKKGNLALAKLPAADLTLAEAQLFCPIVEDSRLGSMGIPVKLMLDGKPVFLCCKGCEDTARANPKATLTKVDEIKTATAKASHSDE